MQIHGDVYLLPLSVMIRHYCITLDYTVYKEWYWMALKGINWELPIILPAQMPKTTPYPLRF
jgi:hypothetical protein